MDSKRSLAVLAALMAGMAATGAAESAPRPVVVINLVSDESAGEAAAARLRAALEAEAELAPLLSGDLSRAFEAALPDKTAADLAREAASAELEAAREALARFEQKAVMEALRRAEAALLKTPPNDAVVALLSELNFIAGLVHLREQNRGLARTAFKLASTLSKERAAIDPARYPPDVVRTFKEATAAGGGEAGTLEVSTTFDGLELFLDGERVGTSPAVLSASPGAHYLVVDGAEFAISGQRIEVSEGERTELVLEVVRLSSTERAMRLRRRALVLDEHSSEALGARVRSALALANADAAIILRADEGEEIVAATYSSGRLSYWRPADNEVSKLFGILSPTPVPKLLPGSIGPIIEPAPWYRKPWVAGIGGGALAIIIGAITLSVGDSPAPTTVLCCGGFE